MASSQATTSAASSLRPRPSSYDVFINFRGVDTRDGFVFLLHDALRREGIHAFIDSEDLWEGEEICPTLLRAIRGSQISIPVFSQRYVESKYCLLELAEIWDCQESNGQIILPIFIGVEPSHLRYPGSFLEPLEKHKRRGEPVETWKNALTKVANLKAWILEGGGDATTKQQSNMIELVVQRALKELNITPLDEQKYLVGIDSHVDELFRLLDIGSDDVRFVGICGMGGLGKTTIAKVVYNRISSKFSGSSFLADVREETSQSQGDKGLLSLQKQLLQDIFKRDNYIPNVFKGKKLIAERLHRENILLIIDDVDDQKQLDALAGEFDWFGQGSKVIITTRDLHVLNVHGRKVGKEIQIYMPKDLNFKNALRLFSLHAFSNNEPPKDYMQLSHEVVHYAEGLPLTLEVLGSFLVDKDKEEWEATLGRLKDIIDDKAVEKSIRNYDDKVFGRLMISYNDLGSPEQTVFLDIACNFNGWEKEKAISMWEACGLGPRLVIKELIQKHLIKIDAGEILKMHDQLRFMGMRIISNKANGNPTKRSRLWSQGEIRKVLYEDTETQMVEGIFLDPNFRYEEETALRWEDFQKLPKLRFLQIDEVTNPSGDFTHLPSKLRWFCWDFHHRDFPAHFYHPELVHLQLSYIFVQVELRLWNDPPQDKKKQFQKLKVLKLFRCMNVCVSPNFISWFPCLQRLSVHSCRGFSELPKLPWTLTHLQVQDCISLLKIADLSHLVKLKVLLLRNCNTLVELPDLSKLRNVKEVCVAYCTDLKKILGLQGTVSLQEFDAMYCENLRELSDLSNLKSLWKVNISHCKNLERIPGLEGTESLEELEASDCHKLTELSHLSKLKRLRRLDITNCENLQEIHGLEGTKSLEELKAKHCHKLTETTRRIHGKGTVVGNIGTAQGSDPVSDDEMYNCSPILCIVFGFTPLGFEPEKLNVGELVAISLDIDAFVHRGGKRTTFVHSIRIEDIEFTDGDIIYIHHFKGLDWFGFPLKAKDTIEELSVEIDEIFRQSDHSRLDNISGICKVKFWKVLFENKESEPFDQQSSALLVADFFRWLDANGDEEVEEEEGTLSASNSKGACLDGHDDQDDDAREVEEDDKDDEDNQQILDQASPVQEKGKTYPSENMEEKEEERDNKTENLVSCVGSDSISEVEWAEEEMLSPSKRSLLHRNHDEASGPELLSQQSNIDDEVPRFPYDFEEAERSNTTLNLFSSAHGGVGGSTNDFNQEVEEEEDETTAGMQFLRRIVKVVWDFFCNCFTTGFLSRGVFYSLLLVVLLWCLY